MFGSHGDRFCFNIQMDHGVGSSDHFQESVILIMIHYCLNSHIICLDKWSVEPTPWSKEEASSEGKRLIDLMDGEELINKLAEYGIGLNEVKSYEIDEDFFNSLEEEAAL